MRRLGGALRRFDSSDLLSFGVVVFARPEQFNTSRCVSSLGTETTTSIGSHSVSGNNSGRFFWGGGGRTSTGADSTSSAGGVGDLRTTVFDFSLGEKSRKTPALGAFFFYETKGLSLALFF